jgi:hypothetical protein
VVHLSFGKDEIKMKISRNRRSDPSLFSLNILKMDLMTNHVILTSSALLGYADSPSSKLASAAHRRDDQKQPKPPRNNILLTSKIQPSSDYPPKTGARDRPPDRGRAPSCRRLPA